MNTFRKVKTIFDRVLRVVIGILMLTMCVVVIWQVVSRYIFNNPSTWSEEVARYCMVWIAMLGTGIAMQTGGHMNLVLLTGRIKNTKIKKTVVFAAYLCCLVLAVVLIIFGIKFLELGKARVASSIPLHLGIVYAAIPAGGCVLLINTCEVILRLLKNNTLADGTQL